MAAAYDAAAPGWRAGAEPLYARLAEAMVSQASRRGVPVADARVLDCGAGTGVAARAALVAGARRVVACDTSAVMLHGCGRGIDAVVADLLALPFPGGAFDVAAAACCLGHLPDPLGALIETRRVACRLVASAFVTGWTHPAKRIVDETLIANGYVEPNWYLRFKRELEPQVGDRARLAALVRAAGYREVDVSTVTADTGIDAPAAMVGWRLGMAHVAPFVDSLPASRRAAVRASAEAELAGAPPVIVPLLVVTAR